MSDYDDAKTSSCVVFYDYKLLSPEGCEDGDGEARERAMEAFESSVSALCGGCFEDADDDEDDSDGEGDDDQDEDEEDGDDRVVFDYGLIATRKREKTNARRGSGSKAPRRRRQSTTPATTRIVVKTTDEKFDDGYRWRKYGNKWVRGSTHPRAYYKCTSEDGVGLLQKHVEEIERDAEKSSPYTFERRRYLVTYYGRSQASSSLLDRLHIFLQSRARDSRTSIDSVEMFSR